MDLLNEQLPNQKPQKESGETTQEASLSLEQKTTDSAAVAKDTNKDPALDKAWYVIRVQSGKEDRVRAALEKRVPAMGMQDKISRILVPTELVSEIRKGFKRVIERKLYLGYVMVEMILTEETHFFIKSTPGVGDIAGKMSESEAERILINWINTKDKPKPKVSFQINQNIKIKEGAFENYEGVVDEVNEQKGIVKVRIEIFGRYTQVELGYWQVESM
jgi:transcriptional antiterminator NusG